MDFGNRSVLLDAVMAAGSNPTVTFLKECVLNRRLSKTESLQAIAGFPLYIRTPTAELLNELFVMNLLVSDGILFVTTRNLAFSLYFIRTC